MATAPILRTFITRNSHVIVCRRPCRACQITGDNLEPLDTPTDRPSARLLPTVATDLNDQRWRSKRGEPMLAAQAGAPIRGGDGRAACRRTCRAKGDRIANTAAAKRRDTRPPPRIPSD